MSKILDMEKICRLCCEQKGRMRSLFEQRPEYPHSLQLIISDVARLEVESCDGMPEKICKWCVTTLLKMHESIIVFRENDLMLRNQLARTTLQIEIKQEEEEMDVEALEQVLTHDLNVDDISVKREDMEEEYLDELNEESELSGEKDESDVLQLDNSGVEMDEGLDGTSGEEEGEWKPTEDDHEDKKDAMVKKYRRRTKQEIAAYGKRKPGRPRTKPVVDRPRLRDYKCYICNSEPHKSPEALIAHLNSIHRDKVPFTCPDCVVDTVVIKGVQGLNAHLRKHLNPEKCPHCDKRFSDKRNLTLHVKVYHQDDATECSLSCEYCGVEFTSKASLLHHMKLHTTAASCEICGKVFKERRKLRMHIQRKHEKLKKYECSFCQKKLASLDSVQMHIQTYHSNQVFKCSYCHKTYGSEASHRSHEKKHLQNPEYVGQKEWTEYYVTLEGQEDQQVTKKKKCLLCGMVTTAMFSHLSSIHFPTEYRCKICGDTFKRKQYYDAHVLEHEYGKAHQCPICNREFTLRKNLIAHLRTKKHQDHPLAQSLDWLGIDPVKSKPRKPKVEKEDGGDDAQTTMDQQAVASIEEPELNVD